MEDMFVKCVLLLIVTIIMLFVLCFVCVFLCEDSYFYIPDLIDKFMDKYFGKHTNGDWIRNMTDEELARFLSEEENLVCILCRDESFDCSRCCKDMREKVFMQWLLKPARDPWEAYDEEGLYD